VRTALDTNILSALWSNEPLVSQISGQLAEAYMQGGLVICGPVYVELFAHPSVSQTFIEEFLTETGITVDFALDDAVWRFAAKGFAAYAQRRRRSAGGTPKRLPVDFLVAAHALHRADRLMTLDAGRYQQDFPNLNLILI
jgi:predicted nucleic acid-binding protein